MSEFKPKVNKFQRDLKQTASSFSPDPVLNRSKQMRRDKDVVKTPSVTLHDIDSSIKWYIRNVIQPKVRDNGELIDVPVMYASPEKWVSVQRDGFMRDAKSKILAPIIVFSRTAMSERNDVPKLDITDEIGNTILLKQKFTQENRYDQFSLLIGQKPVEEFYEFTVPEFVDVEYEMICWTDQVSQLNHIVEQIKHFEGKAWGDRYKFIVSDQSYSFETVNTTGEDRLVRATIGLKAQAHLVARDIGTKTDIQKSFSVGKVVFNEKTAADINDLPTDTGTP